MLEPVTLESALKEYLKFRLKINRTYISSHEMEDARNWILEHKNKQYTVDTISRAWRKLRESNKVTTRKEKVPGSRQMTWKILSVDNSPHRLRMG